MSENDYMPGGERNKMKTNKFQPFQVNTLGFSGLQRFLVDLYNKTGLESAFSSFGDGDYLQFWGGMDNQSITYYNGAFSDKRLPVISIEEAIQRLSNFEVEKKIEVTGTCTDNTPYKFVISSDGSVVYEDNNNIVRMRKEVLEEVLAARKKIMN